MGLEIQAIAADPTLSSVDTLVPSDPEDGS